MSTQAASRFHERTRAHRSPRARAVLALGPLAAVGGIVWAIVAALADHAAAPARPGLLVAVRRAAALGRRRRPRLRVRGRARARRRPRAGPGGGARVIVAAIQPPAEMVHWMFAAGFLLLALLLAAEGVVGQEVWRTRAWRAYLWPGLLFFLGLMLWPVMTFFTNSAIHMIAHGSWAQTMMLAGAAQLGLVSGKLRSRLLGAHAAARLLRLGRRGAPPRAELMALPALLVPPPRRGLGRHRRRDDPAHPRPAAAGARGAGQPAP